MCSLASRSLNRISSPWMRHLFTQCVQRIAISESPIVSLSAVVIHRCSVCRRRLKPPNALIEIPIVVSLVVVRLNIQFSSIETLSGMHRGREMLETRPGYVKRVMIRVPAVDIIIGNFQFLSTLFSTSK